MNSKQRKTLEALFETPVRSNIKWDAVISLLGALEAQVDEGRAGSRVAVTLQGRRAIFHKPHPGNEIKCYCVRDIREFLEGLGVEP